MSNYYVATIILALQSFIWVIIWHLSHAWFEFAGFRTQKIHRELTSVWKRFEWRNPDQIRANQNARFTSRLPCHEIMADNLTFMMLVIEKVELKANLSFDKELNQLLN